MAPLSPVSTSSVRTSKKRGGGRRSMIMLCFLVLFIIVFMWSEELLEPLHGMDDVPRGHSKSEFTRSPLHPKSRNDETTKSRHKKDERSTNRRDKAMDDDLNNFSPQTNEEFGTGILPIRMLPGFDKLKGNTNDDKTNNNKIKPNNQKMKNKKGSQQLRPKRTAKEKFQSFPMIQSTDDNIPMAAGGSVIHAVDALLCRESVLDFVVNATDLKDECDGLKKAYTQTCFADDESIDTQRRRLSRGRRRQRRRLDEKTNPVLFWQRKLSLWSHDFGSWFESESSSSMTTRRFLKEKESQDGHGKEIVSPSAETNSTTHRFLKGKESQNSDGKEIVSPSAETNSQSTADNNQEKDAVTEPKPEKPLANLNLPVMTKHVSGNMLSQTLMLQQDNKLMKAVVNQTNHTVTEAQADAAASSKAVADAADMVQNVLNDPTSVEARTCCTSILNVFHENCNVNEEEELSDRRLFVGVAVIALCGLVKSLIRHFHIRWLPEAAGCIMVGVTMGYILTFYPHHDISFDGKWFLRIMVPPIVFEAALSIDKRSFRRHVVPILFYAVLGTLVATCATAFVVHEGSKFLHCETIPYAEALTFGALISSIDPIAVLSVMSNMGMTDQDTIYVVIFGESLLNDGVAIVLFETLVHFLDDDMVVDSNAVTAATVHFLVVFIGSLLIGLGYGLCCTLYYWMMLGCQTPLVEVLMFCCWALLPYYVCDGIEWSGIVAVVAGGFIMDMYVVGTEKLTDLPNDETDSDYGNDYEKSKERRRSTVRRPIFSKEGLLSKEAKTHITFVTEIIATMMETAIFAYLGLFLFSSRYHWNHNHVFIAISGCCLSRAIMIPSLSSIANWITRFQQSRSICNYNLDTGSNRSNQAAGVVIDAKMQLVLWFAGLRGAMSFALVEHIPMYDGVSGQGTPFKSELKAMTSACIIFTVFILGGGTSYMMEALGMSPKSKSDHTVEREAEMIELLSSVTSIDTEDGPDVLDERNTSDRNSSTSAEIFTNPSTANTLRRPGKPVRRQRKFN